MAGLRIATNFFDRAIGLLRKSSEEELLIVPCRDVHTFGMRYPIDVAFLDKSGCVVKVHRSVVPGRRLKCSRACAVLERKSHDMGEWYEEGQQVELVGTHLERG